MSKLKDALKVRDRWKQILLSHKAIAVIRSPNLETGWEMAQAVAQGGIKSIEIAWNSDRPEELVTKLRQELPERTVGVGTILELQELQKAIACGAQFVFSPHLNADLLRTAVEDYGIPIIPGALSPTEIVTAWQLGASAVKVFPIQAVGGANYIKSLQAPLGQISLIPTGGITLENAPAMISAGAIAVGLSSQLFPKSLVEAKDWQAITQRTKALLTSLNLSVN